MHTINAGHTIPRRERVRQVATAGQCATRGAAAWGARRGVGQPATTPGTPFLQRHADRVHPVVAGERDGRFDAVFGGPALPTARGVRRSARPEPPRGGRLAQRRRRAADPAGPGSRGRRGHARAAGRDRRARRTGRDRPDPPGGAVGRVLVVGEPAQPPSDDSIMRNAMDAQEVAVGWWPGDPRYRRGAFRAYAHPAPEGFSDGDISPRPRDGTKRSACASSTGTTSGRAPTRRPPRWSSPARSTTVAFELDPVGAVSVRVTVSTARPRPARPRPTAP
jgi:hypothetical protein